jgi:carboxyl-terminal processing protease
VDRWAGKEVGEILKLLHGNENTQVDLTIKPQNQFELDRTVTLTRSLIHIVPLHVMTKNNIGYVRLNLFSEQLQEDLKKTLIELKKQDVRAVIIDLRNNPGGVLQETVDVTSLFLDKAIVVNVKGRNPQDIQTYKSTNKDMLRNIPLVVLINKNSASGAEIFAAALKDHKRAILMGEKTFGKGSVQTIYPLSNEGAIKLTTAHFFSPKNHPIHQKGVEPDFYIPSDPQDVLFDAEHDAQMRSAFEFCKNLLD